MSRCEVLALLGFLAWVGGCDDDSSDAEKGTSTGGTIGMISTGGARSSGGAASITGGSTSAATVSSMGGSSTVISSATGGTTAAGGSGSSSTCAMPACLYEMYRPCSPATPPSSCILQDTNNGTVRQTNACYSDGTSASSVTNLTTYATTMTFKKGGVVCYSLESSITLSSSGVLTSSVTQYKNSSGSVVATQVWDVGTNVSTVTCTGGQPVVWDASCDSTSSTDANCQAGVCNP